MDRTEWLKLRKKGIGSSDAAAIWGKSPYMSELELYDDKVSDEVSEETSYVMELGNRLEPEARKLFAAEYNILNAKDETFKPEIFAMPDLGFMMASLDGINESCTEIIEIKFQGKDVHNSGEIREHYMIQMQHQLVVTGASFCWFISYNPKCEKPLKFQKVLPDQDFAKEHLKKCIDFWEKVMKKTPPKPSETDIVTLKGMSKQAKRMIYLKNKIAELEEEAEAIKAQLLEKVTHPKMRCAGIRINKIVKAGSIQYKNIPEIKKMTKEQLEPYRGKTSEYYTITQED
jgi:putative phage-type endonuclease